MFCKKANTSAKPAPMGYRIEWDERITISRTDIRDIPNLADHVSLKYRIEAEVVSGARTMVEIATALGAPVDSVRKALERGEGRYVVRVAGADGVFRWRRSA